MKNIGLILVTLLLGACSLAKFSSYPGVVQTSFPQQLQGTYYIVMPTSVGGHKKAGDTLFYKINQTSVVLMDSSANLEEKPLGSSNVLTLVGGKYHVLSTKDTDWPAYWNCMVYMADKKDIHIYPFIEQSTPNKLAKYFSKTFIGLSDNQDSVFAYTLTDEKFVRYFEKEVKGGQVLKLKRIKVKQ